MLLPKKQNKIMKLEIIPYTKQKELLEITIPVNHTGELLKELWLKDLIVPKSHISYGLYN